MGKYMIRSFWGTLAEFSQQQPKQLESLAPPISFTVELTQRLPA